MFKQKYLDKNGIKPLTQNELLLFIEALKERDNGCYCTNELYITEGFKNSLNYLDSSIRASIKIEGSYDNGMGDQSAGSPVLVIPMKMSRLADIFDEHAAQYAPSTLHR